MKFTNGHWLLKEGCAAFSPTRAYDVKIADHEVIIYAPTGHVNGRADTLGGVNLTIKITSPAPEIFRVQTYHHLGPIKNSLSYDLELTRKMDLEVLDSQEILSIKSGALTLEINKEIFSMTYKREGEILTSSEKGDLALMKSNWKGMAYDDGDSENTYLRQNLGLAVNENIYGLGERFTPFVKNGQTVEIWNEDGGTSTEQTYINIPFYLSNKGYGVFVNNTGRVSYEIGSELVTKVGFSVENGYLDYFFIGGTNMKDSLVKYTDLTGKPALPAPWTFGLWLSTSFTTDYDETTINGFIDEMLKRDIPLRVFHFDCFWMKEYHWSDLLWDDRIFPDPPAMLKRIKEKGINICVWINSYIAQESALFIEGMENGYLLKRKDGTVWQWDMWQPGMALVDFTNPEACKWFQDKLEVLLDMGVDCFKTDFGERIPIYDVEYYNQADPVQMHNYYTYLYNKCVFELLERKRGKGQAVLFARSGAAGSQKFPVHWGGDCWSDYESMSENLRGGLSLTMSGFGFWSHDIGGFESTSTPDVYKRWAAFGLLSTHSRLHGSTSYRVPWEYGEEAVDVVRHFTKLKHRLMPYLFKTAAETSITGIPMMRSMVLEFTDDRNCDYLATQYMLGDSLLVAPVFNADSMAEYYLPEGVWTDYISGKILEGGKWIKEKHGYLSIPLMVRQNSIIAVGSEDSRPDYNYSENVELRIYELQENKEISSVIYDEHANKSLEVTAIKISNKITINVQTESKYTLRLVNLQIAYAEHADFIIDGPDSIIVPRPNESTFHITLHSI